MSTNPIIDELHAIRREYAERFHQDLQAICADARRKQGQQGRPVVSVTPKPSAARRLHQEDLLADQRPAAESR